jgi:hypothetical protein
MVLLYVGYFRVNVSSASIPALANDNLYVYFYGSFVRLLIVVALIILGMLLAGLNGLRLISYSLIHKTCSSNQYKRIIQTSTRRLCTGRRTSAYRSTSASRCRSAHCRSRCSFSRTGKPPVIRQSMFHSFVRSNGDGLVDLRCQ